MGDLNPLVLVFVVNGFRVGRGRVVKAPYFGLVLGYSVQDLCPVLITDKITDLSSRSCTLLSRPGSMRKEYG